MPLWTSQASWCVLDTGFAQGQTFLQLWHGWRQDASRPALLHYVAVLSPGDAAQLQTALCAPGISPSAQTLASHCYGLDAGFHRILLEDGQLSLTLCVGELQTVLTQLDMLADTVLAAPSALAWDKWLWKALARNCKRGTVLLFPTGAMPDTRLCGDAGFALQSAESQAATTQALYNPRWEIRNSRRSVAASGRTPGRCAVVGAGIAGASVARALALRGWQVEVVDEQPNAAGGASGLPVGLVVPHHSADDSPRSRLSRAGTRLMLQHARRLLLAEEDWCPGGVLERNLDGSELNAVEAEVLSQTSPNPSGWTQPMVFGEAPALWHPHAAWIRPLRLVTQWLNHARIRFIGGARVHRLERADGQWLLRAADGTEVTRADTVVFANAYGCAELLQRTSAALPTDFAWEPDLLDKLKALQSLHGTLSLGLCPVISSPEPAVVAPPFPVNGHGSLVWGVPTGRGPAWYAGSTFRSAAATPEDLPQEHAANLKKLSVLLPGVARVLASQFTSAQVQAWQGVRCVSHDRLPLVGPLDQGDEPTLWMSAAMGARGLSFSALCAELLVAEMGAEPLPLESRLARALDTRRVRRRRQTASED
jgi:tRNA 5-methylaminomethyl-2-thiouridine biosynthesis bifunctional protein